MWIFIWQGKGLYALLPLIGLPAGLFVPTVFMFEQQHAIAKIVPFFTEKFAGILMLVAMFGGWFVGGATCFLLGLRWNRDGNDHHLYYIPVQYLGAGSVLLEVGVLAWVLWAVTFSR